MELEKTFECCLEDEASVDNAIMAGGVAFAGIRYIGCIEIVTSMKLLDFQSRSLVVKECIHRVCEAANIRSPSKKRRVDKRVQQCISDDGPCLEHSGDNVILNVSSQCLELTSDATNEVVARHDMPNVSFASGGDSSAMTMVAYVAKDGMSWRACYVVECGPDQAQNVIATVGKAFALRYKNFCGDDAERRNTMTRNQSSNSSNSDKKISDTEYYNDLPGKLPPDGSCDGSVSTCDRRRDRLHSNLIDLNTSIDYANDDNNTVSSSTRDGIFDMHCFSLAPEIQQSQLLQENWYHGPITRGIAESLLRSDGDFLVRAQGNLGQYVLTGLNAGNPKHLLLIDPDGCVRTKDRVFENITHLINYHWSNRLPIISADSALLLRTPVIRTTDLKFSN